ncbi:MAG: EamA family transporter [Alphaproteobacteria bacterium]|nr:EamA family transporter [Alphaproteobacteria bacterium]
MTLLQAGQLSVFAFLLATGQILFKRAAESGPPLRGLAEIVGLAGNLYVWSALLVYGFATLYWIYLLQQVPLTRAYPFAALSFVLVPLFAWLIFGDAVTLRYAGGVALIVLGVYLSGFAES